MSKQQVHRDGEPRVLSTAREDAQIEDMLGLVQHVSNKQGQLLDMHVQAAHYAKAYIDERVGSAAQEARSNAEALGSAVTQVYTEQVVLKEHLAAHLKTIEAAAHTQIQNVSQDLQARQYSALEAFDRRVSELAKCVEKQERNVSLGVKLNEDAIVGFQRAIHTQIEELEGFVKASVDLKTGDKHATLADKIAQLEERVQRCVSIERRVTERADRLAAASQEAISTAVTRLTGRIEKFESRVERHKLIITALEETQTHVAVRISEAEIRCTTHASELVGSAESRFSAMFVPMSLFNKTQALVAAMRVKLDAQDREMGILRASIAAVAVPVSDAALQALQQQQGVQDVRIGALRAAQEQVHQQMANHDQCIAVLRAAQDKANASNVATQFPLFQSWVERMLEKLSGSIDRQEERSNLIQEQLRKIEQADASVEDRIDAWFRHESQVLALRVGAAQAMDVTDGSSSDSDVTPVQRASLAIETHAAELHERAGQTARQEREAFYAQLVQAEEEVWLAERIDEHPVNPGEEEASLTQDEAALLAQAEVLARQRLIRLDEERETARQNRITQQVFHEARVDRFARTEIHTPPSSPPTGSTVEQFLESPPTSHSQSDTEQPALPRNFRSLQPRQQAGAHAIPRAREPQSIGRVAPNASATSSRTRAQDRQRELEEAESRANRSARQRTPHDQHGTSTRALEAARAAAQDEIFRRADARASQSTARSAPRTRTREPQTERVSGQATPNARVTSSRTRAQERQRELEEAESRANRSAVAARQTRAFEAPSFRTRAPERVSSGGVGERQLSQLDIARMNAQEQVLGHARARAATLRK